MSSTRRREPLLVLHLLSASWRPGTEADLGFKGDGQWVRVSRGQRDRVWCVGLWGPGGAFTQPGRGAPWRSGTNEKSDRMCSPSQEDEGGTA